MEPERKIEKLLRAYAKKRRGQDGGPFSLHPATRRLLQGEIARKSPAPKGEEESISLWRVFRRGWVLLVGFALCIFFVATVFFHGLEFGGAKKKAQADTAMNNLKQLGAAMQYAAGENGGKLPNTLDELQTNGMVRERTLREPESQKPFVFAAAGKTLSDLPSNAVLAYSPEDKNGRAVLFADGRVVHASKKEFAEITNTANESLLAMNNVRDMRPATGLPADEAGVVVITNNYNSPEVASAAPMQPAPTPPPPTTLSDENSMAPPPATAEPASVAPPPPPAMTPPASEVAANDSLGIRAPVAQPAPASVAEVPRAIEKAQIQTFAAQRMMTWGLQNNFRNTVMPAQNISVLANFQVQQNGNALRVVDQDGSVYDGSLQMVNNLVEQTETVTDRRNQYQNAVTQVTGGSVTNPAAPPPTTQNYFFRVTGMNRTLNQNVAFSGTLVSASVQSSAQQSFWQNYGAEQRKDDKSANRDQAQRQSEQSAEAAQLPWSSFQINGTAVINNSNQIQILASPVISTNN